jgi:hypothetical protein
MIGLQHRRENKTMLKMIANALAGLWRGTLGVLNWTEQLIRWPFNVVFGSGGGGTPKPEYVPDVSSAQLLDEFEANRQRQAAVHDLDRDGVSTVTRYASAPKRLRDGMDLSAVNADPRAVLLTMDDQELKTLSLAGPGKIRKFLEGKDHGIFGVPAVKPACKKVPEAQSTEMTAQERVLRNIRDRMLNIEAPQQFRLAR